MRKQFLLAIVLLVFSAITFAQQGIITGTVKAEDGSPLPGATVQIKGTTSGTVTDLDGKYSLPIAGVENPTLIFSYVGYLTEEIQVAGQSKIDMKLVTNVATVDEVVVVGYGTQKKSLVTGAISKVNSEQLVATHPERVEQAIQGKIAGVIVSNNSGQPGSAVSVRIRGVSSNKNSSPLYIVDGVKTGGIEYLSPNDIESIEILKDAASAAIYGAEGGNGVVLISTKKGKAGQNIVTYDFSYGWQKYSSKLKMLTGPEYVDYFQKAITYETRAANPTNTDAQITTKVNKKLDDFGGGLTNGRPGLPELGQTTDQNTDWIGAVTNTAPMMEHNLSLSGGNDKTTYNSSISYSDQDGMIGGKKANFKRTTFRLNAEHKANDWLSAGITTTYSRRQRSSLSDNNEFGGVFGNAMMMDPITPVVYASDALANPAYIGKNEDMWARDDQGRPYGMSNYVTNEITNPVAQMSKIHGAFTEDKILAGAWAQIEPVKGLTYRSSIDWDVADNSNAYWSGRVYYDDQNITNKSSATQVDFRYFTWHYDNVVTYNKTIGKNAISVMVGSHAELYNHIQLQGTGNTLVKESDAFSSPGAAQSDSTINGQQALANSQRFDPERLASVFGRLTYNYAEKYLFNFTIRRDGSSKLAPGHQYGIFPSYSIGWVVSNERFWSIPVINTFKLRLSYGTNGNLSNINAFQYVSTISFSGSPYTDASGNLLNSGYPTQLSNEKLAWEESKMTDGGLDMNLFNNKVSLTLDYFYKKTTGLLTSAPISGYVGNSPPSANAGDIVNKGLEIELTYRQAEGDFHYSVGGNVSFLKNKVTYIGTSSGELNGANLSVGGEITHAKEGEPIWYFYGYKVDGVWKNQAQIDAEDWATNAAGVKTQIQKNVIPGDVRIVDVNGDSIININDRTKIGSPWPKALMGLNLNADYKGIDLSINIIGSFGNDDYFGVYRGDLNAPNKPEYFLTDAWSPTNEDATFMRPVYTKKTGNLDHNSMYLQNGSYVKFKTVTLGYTLPSIITQKIKIAKLRVYVSGNNLITITKYKGADPEIGNTVNENGPGGQFNSFGVDRGYYPQARTYMLGVNVTF